MNEKQKLEMIAMCAQALVDGKKVQMESAGIWHTSNDSIYAIVDDIYANDRKYRIKPEPKTLQYRVALMKRPDYMSNCADMYYLHPYTIGKIVNEACFVKWADEVKTVELPE